MRTNEHFANGEHPVKINTTGNCMFKVINVNTRPRCEICSKLTIKTPERRQWCRSGVFIVNYELISNLVLVFLLITLSRLSNVEVTQVEIYLY